MIDKQDDPNLPKVPEEEQQTTTENLDLPPDQNV